LSLDQCEEIYTKLSSKVFSGASSVDKKDQGYWGLGDSLYKMVKSGSDFTRFALTMASASAKHDPTTFEALVKELANLGKLASGSSLLELTPTLSPDLVPLPLPFPLRVV
jgi:hypothetical protein